MLCYEENRFDANECLDHSWFKLESISKAAISSQTLKKLTKFSSFNILKKVILNYIAYSGLSQIEIEKYRKIFLKLDHGRKGFIGK
mmetsp:Transcript_34944/g.33988  ORF Transcript_34944/g.33988 Transcript_34944/m.33988 type:complete len:86 (-) Transcript_34944:399-656(-)